LLDFLLGVHAIGSGFDVLTLPLAFDETHAVATQTHVGLVGFAF
jgi:hypothetical protein